MKVERRGKRGGIKTLTVNTVPQLTEALRGVPLGYDRKHDQMMLLGMFIADRLCAIEEELTGRKASRRNTRPSEWNLFFGEGMKAGKSPAQISAEWQDRKVKRIS